MTRDGIGEKVRVEMDKEDFLGVSGENRTSFGNKSKNLIPLQDLFYGLFAQISATLTSNQDVEAFSHSMNQTFHLQRICLNHKIPVLLPKIEPYILAAFHQFSVFLLNRKYR